MLVTAEDRRELLLARLRRIMEEMQLSAEERAKVCADVLIWDVTGSVCRLTELDGQGNVVLTGLADAIVEHFRDASPVVVGLDPVISFGAGERIVNDNEHSLILAARRIVRGLGCCVRLICHVSKEVARSRALDQYASRGGSALADGARMVTVLRSWDPEATDDKLIPPPGLSFGTDEQVIVLARPKLSYAPPQPLIWVTRRGYAFRHFAAARTDPEAEAKARADQLERFLISQLASGARHSQKTLEATAIIKPRDNLRAALASLIAFGRVVYAPLPEELRHGGRKDYLHPVTSPAPEASGPAARSENGPKADGSPPSPTTSPKTHPPTGGGGTGGEVGRPTHPPTPRPTSPARSARYGEVGEVGAVNPPDGQFEGDGPEHEPAEPTAEEREAGDGWDICMFCNGNGCLNCGGTGIAGEEVKR